MATLFTARESVRADCSECQFRRACRRQKQVAVTDDELTETSPASDFTYISFGAGVQSTALLVMSNLGLRACPRADVAIFADTQGEPAWVYEHLAFMERWSAIPVIRVTTGDLAADLKDRLRGRRRR